MSYMHIPPVILKSVSCHVPDKSHFCNLNATVFAPYRVQFSTIKSVSFQRPNGLPHIDKLTHHM